MMASFAFSYSSVPSLAALRRSNMAFTLAASASTAFAPSPAAAPSFSCAFSASEE